MNKHTATPWEKDYGGIIGHIKAVIEPRIKTPTICRYDMHAMSISDDEAEANAAYIVKAVNSHEALVEALKASKIFLIDDNYYQEAKHLIATIETALKLAGEEVSNG